MPRLLSCARARARRRLLALAACAVLALAHAPAFAAADDEALTGRALLGALKTGGLIVYFRHGATDFGENDLGMADYADCAHQRNLTEGGRADARAIGAAIKRLALPIGDVLASPLCRTMETATLIFGRAVATPAVLGGPAAVAPERYAGLTQLLSTPPSSGTDLVIVSHGNPFRSVSRAPYLAEGEAAVIRPLGAAGFHIVARIPKDGWDSLDAP
jgi:phosphohistidine phosphatase SixA